MTAQLIDGKATAAAERERIASETATLAAYGVVPGLAAILVGDDPASHVYVGQKERMCERVGMTSHGVRLPADTTQDAASMPARMFAAADEPSQRPIASDETRGGASFVTIERPIGERQSSPMV